MFKLSVVGGGLKMKSGFSHYFPLYFFSQLNVDGGDVIIVDDLLDTAGTLHSLSTRLKNAGARNVYLCASHGIFFRSVNFEVEEFETDGDN